MTLYSHRKAYVDMKAKEKGITQPTYADNKQGSSREHDGRGNRPFNAFRDWGNRSDDKAPRAPKEVKVFVEGKELDVDTETGKIKNPDEITYQPGKVAKFEGVGDDDNANPIELKVCYLSHPVDTRSDPELSSNLCSAFTLLSLSITSAERLAASFFSKKQYRQTS